MRLKKGSTSKDAYEVIMHDLECLELKNTPDNKYHMKLLQGNLQDLFGRKQ